MSRTALLLSAILASLLACHETSMVALRRASLEGEVRRYTAAHGSGKGMILRVPLPDRWASAIIFDSIDIKGKLLPCRLTDEGKILEANWFLPSPGSEVSVAGLPSTADSWLPEPGQLLPAYIWARKDGKKLRITISSLTERPENQP